MGKQGRVVMAKGNAQPNPLAGGFSCAMHTLRSCAALSSHLYMLCSLLVFVCLRLSALQSIQDEMPTVSPLPDKTISLKWPSAPASQDLCILIVLSSYVIGQVHVRMHVIGV
jgi:hypothetical protein